MDVDSLLAGLTPAQREAVEHVEGPLLILAGPGSGKTRVITHRIAYLLHMGVRPESILALTFTNKAAEEMRSRVERLVPGRTVWMGTFHRFCARLLRQYARVVGLSEDYVIYDTEDSARALATVLSRMGVDRAHVTPAAVAAAISWAKNHLVGPDEYRPRAGHPLGALLARVYPAYQEHLLRANAMDFDDLLLHAARLLRDHPEIRRTLDHRYRFVLVDEYQDTNLAQYAIARALSIDYPNLAVTGDPDQSIYGWRGANLNNILEFEKDFPGVKVVRLEQNYRSTQRILRVAEALIAHNVRRKPKALFTHNGEGVPVRLVTYASQREEAEGIASHIAQAVSSGRRRPRDFAVFYRVNALSRSVELALRRHGVPYQVVQGVEFFRRKEIRDVLAYLRLIQNPRDDVAFLRVINEPPRGLGAASLRRLSDYAAQHRLPLVEAARQAARIPGIGRRAVGTLQQFVAMLDRLAASADCPMKDLLARVLAESSYKARFENSTSEEDQQRLANIEELLTVAREFDDRAPDPRPLADFLEELSLVGDTDDWQSESDRVTLMTLHAAKGLEFPVVFLIACEQGLLPHERSRDQPEQLEEERRLMFVGMTRAQEELQLSRVVYRDFRGQPRMTVPSPFLMELPRAEMDCRDETARLVPDATCQLVPEPSEHEFAVECTAEEVQHEPAGVCEGQAAAGGAAQRPGEVLRRLPGGLRLVTAADLAGAPAPAPPSPDDFYQGMTVLHPEQGVGIIVAIRGQGAQRAATVDFRSTGQRQEFVIATSGLRPLR